MTQPKKKKKVAPTVRWTKDWFQSASPEELLQALDGVEEEPEGSSPMDQLLKRLTWDARFQMLEEELKRRMKRQSA
jgi:hypothetical protein